MALAVCLGEIGVFPNMDAVFDEWGRDRFGIVPRTILEDSKVPDHPILSWTEQIGRSWNYWRMRGTFYLPCLEAFKKRREIAPGVKKPLFMSEYPISFNSFKNVTWFPNTS